MKEFAYHLPSNLGEACNLLEKLGDEASVIAGGTDLLPRMKDRQLNPKHLISLKSIPGLRGIQVNGDSLVIGALTTVSELVSSGLVAEKAPLLSQAAALLASVHIRNVATVGGNLCNAAPSADLAPALLVLEARARIAGPGGERVVPLEKFFSGPGETALAKGEILSGLEVPIPAGASGGWYCKYSLRRAMDIAVVGAAVLLTLDQRGERCLEARIALGAVAPTPFRVRQGEKALIAGEALSAGLAERVGELAAAEARPISDVRSSAEYRRKMVKVQVKRAIIRAWEEVSR